MKKTLYTLYIIIGCCIMASCDKLPKNGDLDGMWQLMTIEHNGTTNDVKDRQLYLSFQLDLFQLTKINSNTRYYGYFDNLGDRIVFRNFSDMAEEHPDNPDNYPITDLSIIEPWGYYALSDTFHIESLTRNDMALRSKNARITYRKF
ncbi:MAG: lipocalin-like domain-containing protein [Bacteroidaceae bacterium]|nr:lipocalin-like domain-containing protein [Bacteroidaceae bacterium]